MSDTPTKPDFSSVPPTPALFAPGPYQRLTDSSSQLTEISESLLICGDARRALSLLPTGSVQTVVTSAPVLVPPGLPGR